jgi:phage-related protein
MKTMLAAKPCLEWIRELDARERRVLGTALREILQQQGINVCSSSFGKQLGEGLFEFRLRTTRQCLRADF